MQQPKGKANSCSHSNGITSGINLNRFCIHLHFYVTPINGQQHGIQQIILNLHCASTQCESGGHIDKTVDLTTLRTTVVIQFIFSEMIYGNVLQVSWCCLLFCFDIVIDCVTAQGETDKHKLCYNCIMYT